MTREQIVKETSRVACKLQREHGIPRTESCMIAARAVLRVLGQAPGSGMGQATAALAKAAELEPVKAVREAVSPWLWIFSVASFGMAILNTRRIGRMFKGWSAKRRPA